VPVIDENRLPYILGFLATFAEMLASVIVERIRQKEATEALKESEPRLRIIASAYARTEHAAVIQILGAGRYLKKPHTLETIGMAVKNKLRKHAGWDSGGEA